MQYVKGAPPKQEPAGPLGEFKYFTVHFAGYSPEQKAQFMKSYFPRIMEYGSWMNNNE